MTKKVPKKILRIERHFFVNLRKNCFWPPTPRRRGRFFGPGAAPPPPTEIDRRAAADTMTSAHSSTTQKLSWLGAKVKQNFRTKNVNPGPLDWQSTRLTVHP